MKKYLKIIGIIQIVSSVILMVLFVIDAVFNRKIFDSYGGTDSITIVFFVVALFIMIFIMPSIGILFYVVSNMVDSDNSKKKFDNVYKPMPKVENTLTTNNLMKTIVSEVEEVKVVDGVVVLKIEGITEVIMKPCFLMLQIFKNRISYMELEKPQQLKVLLFPTSKEAQQVYEVFNR